MALVIRTLHAAEKPELLNEEWIVVENTGAGALTSAGWTLGVARAKGQRPSALGTLSPGFTMQPGDKVRLVTGTGSKKSQGTPPPENGMKNYHLFLRAPILARAGVSVHIHLKALELARATFDPAGVEGVRAAADPARHAG